MSVNINDAERPRVSVLARVVPALPFMTVAIGAAAGALYVRNIFWAMREAESAGVAAVAGGLAEANLFVLVALYLAIALGLVGLLIQIIRSFVQTKTAPPSILFFVAVCVAGVLAPAFMWTAESTLIGSYNRQAHPDGIATVAFTINWLMILSMCAAPLSILFLLAASVWPLSTNAKRRWGPIIGMLAIVVVLIILAVAFQVRTSWFHQVKELEHW